MPPDPNAPLTRDQRDAAYGFVIAAMGRMDRRTKAYRLLRNASAILYQPVDLSGIFKKPYAKDWEPYVKA
jgi:hypothetical protein